MESQLVLSKDAEEVADGFQRTFALIGIGYAALVCLAFYADYKIQMRRARKRRERKEQEKERRD